MSLHRGDWAKIIGGLALATTGLGAAGIGPLAGMLAAGGTGAAGAAGVGAAGAGAAGTASGFGSAIAPSLVTSGVGSTFSGLMGTPKQTMTQPSGAPPPLAQPDVLAELMNMMKKHGSFQ